MFDEDDSGTIEEKEFLDGFRNWACTQQASGEPWAVPVGCACGLCLWGVPVGCACGGPSLCHASSYC